MTESEWDSSTDRQKMLAFLRSKANDRKWWLFVAACCRGITRDLAGVPARIILPISERLADGLATPQERQAAWEAVEEWKDYFVSQQDFESAARLRDFREVL